MPRPDGYPTQGQGIVSDDIEYPDEILVSTQGAEKAPGGVIIAAGSRSRDIRIGEILARLTADVTNVGDSGQYIARKSTELAATAAEGQGDLTVDDAHPFVAGDTILILDGTAEVIQSINYTTNVITIVGNITADGTDPRTLNGRVSVTASGQRNTNGIAGQRYTHNTALGSTVTGRCSMYTAGLFRLAKLKGSGAVGLDTAARAAFAGTDQILAQETAVRCRLGDPTAAS